MRRIGRGIALLFKNPRRLSGRLLGPRVLVTSVPKSGTNLLVHTLSLFPTLTFDGTITRLSDEEKIRRISTIRKGCVLSSHHAKSQELDEILGENNIKVLFVIRDPRDVSVSLHYWIKKTGYHYFHSTYNSFSSDTERLEKIIRGYEPENSDESKQGIISIDWHFRRRLSWMDDKGCLTVRFEDLVGSSGGGENERQLATITKIARFLDTKLSNQDISRIQENVYSNRTATFRKGQIGSWQEEFTDKHRTAFKEVAGQLLIDLGYEKDLHW